MSCKKELYNDQLFSPNFQLLAADLYTKSDGGDYSVTKGMVESFILSNPKHKDIFSIEGYPSEDYPTMYIVNYDDGWAIYPADSRFGMILAENPVGHLNVKSISQSVGFQFIIKDYQQLIEHFRELPMDEYDESSVQFWNHFRHGQSIGRKESLTQKDVTVSRDGMLWVIVEAGSSTEDSIMVDIGHLLYSEWGQEEPWNNKMPIVGGQHCVTGCAPLAIAQVLHYFNKWNPSPSGLYHSISEQYRTYNSWDPNYDCLSLTLSRDDYTPNSPRWAQMPNTNQSGAIPDSVYSFASDLILDVGVRLNTRYGLEGSGVYVNPSNNFFDLSPVNLSYSWGTYSYQMIDTVMTNLRSWKPVIITASNSSNGYSTHTWVIDGFFSYRIFYQNDYELWPVSMIPEGARIIDLMSESQLASLYPDYYPGKVIHERDGYLDLLYYKMNFGDNGVRKGNYYSVWPYSSWEGYDSIKSIHYNLSPGDLLIQ